MPRSVVRGAGLGAMLVVLAVACATGEPDADFDGFDRIGEDGAGDGSTLPDSPLPRPDGGPSESEPPDPGDDAGGGGVKDAGGEPCTGKIVINELMPNGVEGTSSNVEFIELYNAGGCTVSLTGWRLQYRASSGNQGPDIYAFKAADVIGKQGFFVLGKANFTGKKDREFTTASGLGNSGGQLGLVDENGTLVDAVGYGPSSGAFTEGSPAPLPAEGRSVGRKSDGVDSDDNLADFKVFPTHSAGAPN